MTTGVGGSTAEAELAKLRSMRDVVPPIGAEERHARVAKVQRLMRERGVDALYLDASTANFYFTGLRLKGSERLHGAVIPAEGEIAYITPAFEQAKLETMISLPGRIHAWHEHEDPTALVIEAVRATGHASGTIAIDPATPYFTVEGLQRAGNSFAFVNARPLTAACRMIKSAAEIALMTHAMNLTLGVQRAAAAILRPGIATTEVEAFVGKAHTALGFDSPASFCIVLFGEATAYPHGVPHPQILREGDTVLIDIGAPLHGYQSDITRTYVFGEPSARQREVWDVEKRATEAVFAAARLGAPCEALDRAARDVIEGAGFAREYGLPGLPHRTGHGIGLDVHEEPYIVRGDATRLAPGMCFSNEPTICIYGEFGVRLEDHIHMTETGPAWFTTPSPSIDDPFGLGG